MLAVGVLFCQLFSLYVMLKEKDGWLWTLCEFGENEIPRVMWSLATLNGYSTGCVDLDSLDDQRAFS